MNEEIQSPSKTPRLDSNSEDHPVFGKLLPLAKLKDLEKLPTFLQVINAVRHVKGQYSVGEIKNQNVKRSIYLNVSEVRTIVLGVIQIPTIFCCPESQKFREINCFTKKTLFCI